MPCTFIYHQIRMSKACLCEGSENINLRDKNKFNGVILSTISSILKAMRNDLCKLFLNTLGRMYVLDDFFLYSKSGLIFYLTNSFQ